MQAPLEALLLRHPELKNSGGTLEHAEQLVQGSLHEALPALNKLVCHPRYTLQAATCFRPCLLPLVSALVEQHVHGQKHPDGAAVLSSSMPCESFAVALLKLLELAPHISSIVIRYFEHCPGPHFYLLAPILASSHQQQQQQQHVNATELAFASLLGLQLLPELRKLWGSGPFLDLLLNEGEAVRWAAVQALGIQLDLSDTAKTQLSGQYLTAAQQVEVQASWQAQRATSALESASMWLPNLSCPMLAPFTSLGLSSDEAGLQGAGQTRATGVAGGADTGSGRSKRRRKHSLLEQQRGGEGAEGPLVSVQQQQQQQQQQPCLTLPEPPGFVGVCGVDLPRRVCPSHKVSSSASNISSSNTVCSSQANSVPADDHGFVDTPTVARNLRAAALALCADRPLLLEGPPGCGKTRLIQQLADLTHNTASMVHIHLDDQMDAKSLLGAYMCSAVPGEFAWQPGPLTQAVSEGRWVVIEDINMAPPDVLAALVPLLESRTLTVASRGEVLRAEPGFQLIATVTSAPSASGAASEGGGGAGAYATSNMAKELLGSLWTYVRLSAPASREHLDMLAQCCPATLPLLPAAVAMLELVHLAGGHAAPPLSLKQQLQQQQGQQWHLQQEAANVSAMSAEGTEARGGDVGEDGDGLSFDRPCWWQTAAASALARAGLRPGELALVLGRHFSVRDLFKWAARMQAMHANLLAARGLRPLSSAAQAMTMASGAAEECQSAAGPPAVSYDLSQAELRLREAAFVEGADIVCALVPEAEARRRLLKGLAGIWTLPLEQAVEWYENLHKPTVNEAVLEVVVGRAVLDRQGGCTADALTSHSSTRNPSAAAAAAVAAASGSQAVPSAGSGKKSRKGSSGGTVASPVAQGAATSGCGGLGTFARTGHAMRLMERVAVCLAQTEPVLLVGETGTGKTTLVSRLSGLCGRPLVAFNMSQQTDSGDLLGGFKPVEARDALGPLLQPFIDLTRRTWAKGNNEEFLLRCTKYAEKRRWGHLLQAFHTALAKVAAVPEAPTIHAQQQPQPQPGTNAEGGAAASATVETAGGIAGTATAHVEQQEAGQQRDSKRRKVASSAGGTGRDRPAAAELRMQWRAFAADLATAERAAAVAEGGFAFAFVEGKLVQALREGWWILLDEINLAPAEVLERIAGLLEGVHGSITLAEKGDTHTVTRHPGFRLIAAMNPATDAGKRELPAPLRNRFTEIWVPEPSQREDLRALVQSYLAGYAVPAISGTPVASGNTGTVLQPIDACVELYVAAKAEADMRLTDGAGSKPAYSLRTLCRALDYARTTAPNYGLQRALYDGFSMAFATQLSPESQPRLEAILQKHLLPGVKYVKALLRTPPEPAGDSHILFEHFWLKRGPLPLPEGGQDDDGASRRFVLTPSVKRQLVNLARAVLVRKHPILLQGPTSSGKTSLVGYLAAQTGHKLVRINNHEHTDLQEYLGSYVADSSGRLAFREGALVTAVRQGHWVVLDELNLAPSDVLEALNRLLDDNRELFVPELNEVVKPHPAFMLFATQNPPGAYAGRKALSRAFRSRFLELHVEDIPDRELAEILERRCALPASYASKLVMAMRELQRWRQATNVFAGKHGFITPRDLFKWAERGAVGYQALAEDGALILGERLRSAEERQVVADVLAHVMNAKVDLESVFVHEGDAPVRQLQAALQQHQHSTPACTISSSTHQSSHGAKDATTSQGAQDAADAHGCSGEELVALQHALRGVVWTRSMRRMYTLVDRCLRHMEPVLLVGETGTGKTTVCQLLALMRGQRLHVLNCNQHTETSDFLGGFRPARGRDRLLAGFGALAAQVLAHPLIAESGAQAPIILDPPSVTEIPAAAAQLQAAASHASKWVQQQHAGKQVKGKQQKQLQQQQQQALEELQGLVRKACESASLAVAPFVWVDGPLVTAMRRGDMLLVDEINLAEDAVLERLNSVLEPGRTLTLAERGGEGAEVVVAAPGFRLLATMNPGGDYGKKELSPALSNRFTTIWVPALEDERELEAILAAQMGTGTHIANDSAGAALAGWEVELQGVPPRLLAFWRFFHDNIAALARCGLSVRDLLAWATFVRATAPRLGALAAYVHGAHLTLLDGLGAGVGLDPPTAAFLRAQCAAFLRAQLPPQLQPHVRLAEGELQLASALEAQGSAAAEVATDQPRWGFYPFYMPVLDAQGNPLSTQPSHPRALPSAGDASDPAAPSPQQFELSAPTTARNAFRLLRALQLRKAVLVEGSPGVGKTALVGALARHACVPLVRINLSEQTDMMDLLGADLPSAGGEPGQFTWCDGPLLGALKSGQWVLLDELNLASQSVLEGLNALLDHRAEVFIPELGLSYRCHPRFRLFAAQNPLQEGGGRKGLPRSFLNRFTRVYAEALGPLDLRAIASTLHPRLPLATLDRMIALLALMGAAATGAPLGDSRNTCGARDGSARGGTRFAVQGGPWEFNLRDLLRWADLTVGAVAAPVKDGGGAAMQPGTHAQQTDVDVHQQQQQGAASVSHAHARLDEAAEHYAHMLFVQRLRTQEDRARFGELFARAWGRPMAEPGRVQVLVSPDAACIGRACIIRQGAGGSSLAMSHSSQGAAADDAREFEELQLPGGTGCPDGVAGDTSEELHLLDWQLPHLESMSQALARNWMVLLVSGPSCGKTRLARLGARLAGRTLIELPLTSGTDTSDLLGSFEQVEPSRRVQEAAHQVASLVSACSQHLLVVGAKASSCGVSALGAILRHCKTLQAAWHAYTRLAASERQARSTATPESHMRQLTALQAALAQCKEAAAALLASNLSTGRLLKQVEACAAQLSVLEALLADESSRAVAGRFEWVDGVLARAIINGGWVLMDNANLCNPTVLDRLNPLLEPNGVLYMNECGSVGGVARVLAPHPNFRLILALDPRHGEVSRAMRNRGIELYLLPPHPPIASSPSTKAAPDAAAAAVLAAQAASQAATYTSTVPLSSLGLSSPTSIAITSAAMTAAEQAQQGALCVLSAEGMGVGGPGFLAAMAHTHAAVCALAAGAHRRPPGLGALAGWARLARILAQRGWSAGEALKEAWNLAYLGSLVLSIPQVAAANVLLSFMLSSMGFQPTPPTTTSLPPTHSPQTHTPPTPTHGALPTTPPLIFTPCGVSTGSTTAATDAAQLGAWSKGDGEEGWGGIDTSRVAHIDLTTSAYAADTTVKQPAAPQRHNTTQHCSVQGHTEVPQVIRPLTMAQPATWPRLLSGSSLFSNALTAPPERDSMLLSHLTAACAAHAATQQQQSTSTTQRQDSSLCSFGSALPVEQRHLLCWLPPPLVTVLLRSPLGRMVQGAWPMGNKISSSSSDIVGLHRAAWVAGRLIVERSTGGNADAQVRLQWVKELAAQAQAMAQLLDGPSPSPLTSPSPAKATAALLTLISTVVQQLLQHPLAQTVRTSFSQHLHHLGAAQQLHNLQPLDPRYCHLTAPATVVSCSAQSGGEGSAQRLRLAWLQWQGLTRAVPQWLLQQHAAAQADAAVGGGCETPYQSSCWRVPRPEARALHAPPFHPVVDALAPLLHTITDIEQVVLALPLAPSPATQAEQQQQREQQQVLWSEEIAEALEQVAKWRGVLWGLCHGPLHVPPPSSPAKLTNLAHHNQHQHQQQEQQVSFDVEGVSWVWRHLDKALGCLVRVLPSLLSEDATLLSAPPDTHQAANGSGAAQPHSAGLALVLASRLAHARREGRAALGMQHAPSKPLLWRLGGRPLLPHAPEALEARLHAAGLGRVAGLEGGKLGAVDVRGYPEVLTAAVACVGAAEVAAAAAAEQGAVTAAGDAMKVDGGSRIAVDEQAWRGVDGLVEEALHAAGAPVDGAEGSTEARESVSRAVAAVLATDGPLRRAVAQGLAMLAFIPVAAALAPPTAALSAQQLGSTHKLHSQTAHSASASAVDCGGAPAGHGSEVVRVLVQGVLARARSAAHAAATLCAHQKAVALTDDNVSMGLMGGSSAHTQGGKAPQPTDTAPAPPGSPGPGQHGMPESLGSGHQLLPARFMALPACRSLQEGLLALQDVQSLRSQAGLISAASKVLAGWAAHSTAHGAPPTPTQCAPDAAMLLRAVQQHMDTGVSGGSRLPTDFAAHQQLAWVLEEMVAQGQRQQSVADAGPNGGGSDALMADAPAVAQGGKQVVKGVTGGSSASRATMSGAQWDHLHAVVLPALLHELRLPWHAALWACANATAHAGGAGVAMVSSEGVGPALLLHNAARAWVAAGIASDQRAGSVQAREARLMQLCLSIRHFLQLTCSIPLTLPTLSEHPLSLTPMALSHCGSWATLASLAAHTLLAHTSSLPDPHTASSLARKLQHLLAQVSSTTPDSNERTTNTSSSMAISATVSQVATVLAQSNHTLLRSLVQPLILPALEALAQGLTMQQQIQQGLLQHDQTAPVQAAQGKCWVLLGAARLQLLVPPPGVDPAGKYATKARWLRAQLASEIGPEEAVRRAAQQLPGGPDESLPLAQLASRRTELSMALSAACVHAVPRPRRSRYVALRAEIAVFAEGLGGVGRVCALLHALCPTSVLSTPSTQPPLTPQAAANLRVAVSAAGVWQSNAGAWVARLGVHFPEYLDLVQPVQLAVQEVRHGLALLCAVATARATCTPSRAHLAAQIVSGLMAFPAPPSPLPSLAARHEPSPQQQQGPQQQGHKAVVLHSSTTPTVTASCLQPLWLGSLTDPTTLKLVVEASILAIASSLPSHLDASKRAQAAEMAAYTARLRAGRVALRTLARALIAAGPHAALALLQPSSTASLPHSTPSRPNRQASAAAEVDMDATTSSMSTTVAAVHIQPWVTAGGADLDERLGGLNSSNTASGLAVLLSQLEGLLCGFVGQWAALKAHEERVAAKEAEMFKTKVRSTTMLNEEEEAERDFLRHFPPSHQSPFADIPGLEDDTNPAPNKEPNCDPMDTAANRAKAALEEEQGVLEGEATEAQASSKAARQLLDGEALADIVHLHAAVFGTLSGTLAPRANHPHPHMEPAATQQSFAMAYELGAELLQTLGLGTGDSINKGGSGCGSEGCVVGRGASAALLLEGASVDHQTLNGHLFKFCCEHATLSKAAAATSADAAAAALGRAGKRKQTGRKGKQGGTAEEEEEEGGLVRLGIDIQAPCVEEIVLLQEPVRAMSRRLVTLLAEFPEHPVLAQLMAIASRCLSLPAATTPLKTALTGMELLLTRAQVWEDTAAKFVSVEFELAGIAALATRWRRLELASWRGTLARVTAAHAAGAHHSWFHLYQVLVAGMGSTDAGSQQAGEGGEGEEVSWWQAAKVWRGTGPNGPLDSTAVGRDASPSGTEAQSVEAGAQAEAVAEETWYRRSATTLEAFLQTSTVGEYEARLQLLASFRSHLQVRQHLLLATSMPSPTRPTAPEKHQHQRLLQRGHLLLGALANTHAYYAQFMPSVRAAIAAGMAPHEKDLADFVALAKWEDHGYYALRANAEKAQRHLHKLRRRGEEVLRQPAAGVLATAVRSMGVPEFVSAVRTLQAAEEAQKPQQPPQPGSRTKAHQGGLGPAVQCQPTPQGLLAAPDKLAAAKARRVSKQVLKARSALSLLLSEASGLEAGELVREGAEWEDVDPLAHPPNMHSWAQLCAAAKHAADAQHSLQTPASLSLTTPAKSSEAATFKLQGRLRQLTIRLASLLTASLAVDPTAAPLATSQAPPLPGTEQQQPQTAAIDSDTPGHASAASADTIEWSSTDAVCPGAVSVDELAATAAAMSVELRGDVSRGCRLRKRKALADYLGELQALGLSKWQADVPQGEREAVSWFKQPQPNLTPLFQATPTSLPTSSPSSLSRPAVDPVALSIAAEAWTKSGAYYYRAIARMHKLWAAAAAPHKDVSLAECATAQHCCEHLLLQLRRQRAALGQVAAAHTALKHQGTWLQQLGQEQAPMRTDDPDQQRHLLWGLPPQQATLEQLQARKRHVDCLEQQAADTAQLLDACSVSHASPSPQHQARLERAATCAHATAQRLRSCCEALAAELAATHLRLTLSSEGPRHQEEATPPSVAALTPQHHAVSTTLCWASQSTWQALISNRQELHAAAEDVAAVVTAPSTGPRGADVPGVPGMADLATRLRTAAIQAASWEAGVDWGGVQGPSAASASPDATTSCTTSVLNPSAWEGAATTEAAAFGRDLETAVSSVLIWAQGLDAAAKSDPQQTPAGDTAVAAAASLPAGPKGLLRWTDKLEAATQANRAQAVVHSMSHLLQRVSAIRDLAHTQTSQVTHRSQHTSVSPTTSHPTPHTNNWEPLLAYAVARLNALAPLLALVQGALQQQALRWVGLHRACAKLAYISAAIFGTLMEEGFCGPQDEGQATEGGDGKGDTQEVQGTGMGEGDTRGAKDVSDKIDNEDQLLGAQQQEQQEEEQQDKEQGGQEDNDDKGVEMEADFEGTMQDMPKEDKQDMEDEEDEEGDADRIDQQMGDVGDNEQVVDEKLWNSDDEEDKGKEQGKDKKEEQCDDRGTISVDDKKDLDNEAGRGIDEENLQDKDKQDQPKAEKKKDEAGKQDEQGKDEEQGGAEEGPDGEEEQEEAEEGAGVNDADDKYADRQDDFVKPEALEEEMQLSEGMNLDGGEEGQQEEEQGAGEEAKGQDEQGAMDVDEGAGADDKGEGKEEADKEGKNNEEGEAEGGEDQPSNKPDGDEQQAEEEEGQGGADDPKAGVGKHQPENEQPPPGEEPNLDEPPPETEPAAAHGLNEEEGPQPPEAQQAGPQGVASKAALQQAQSTGRAAGEAPHQPQPAQEQQEQPQAGDDNDAQDAAAPETATSAQQAQMGRSGAHNQCTGAPAPQQSKGGGAQPDASMQQEQQRKQQQQQQQRPEPNPLRDLGDAMERWKASLATAHEVPSKEEEEQEADPTVPPLEEQQPEQQGDEGGGAKEYQFLQPGQQQQAGDTQALAPATEEQAKELDEAARQQQDKGPEDPQLGSLVDELQQEDDQAAGEDEGAAQEPMQGVAPKQWQGAQRDARMQGADKAQAAEGTEVGKDGVEGDGDAGQNEQQQHAQLMERLFGPQSEGTWGGTEGGNLASVCAPGSLEAEEAEAAEAARKLLGKQTDGEGTEVQRLLGLAPEEAQALRAQLDARLQDAASGATATTSAAGLQYGNEVWARCEALTAGLSGELAEQLRLILEPTQASKLAGDYRTGKRISMRKVIAYIASHFRKDKIWLRRNRPDKRRYQVLLAVDDSRSMAECGCGGMALEALTLLCKSMSRLEVGQIGVLKFGGPEGAVPLHSLSQPFSDVAGPGIMSSLRFDQDNTIGDQPMLRLMETLDQTLELARHEGGAGRIGAGTQDLAQLVLVVADGRLHEKEGLRTRVRELAAKRGVCLAFIAIDAQATTNTAAPTPHGSSQDGSSAAVADMMDTSDQEGTRQQQQEQQQREGADGGGVGQSAVREEGASRKAGSEKAGGGAQGGSSLLDMQTVSFMGGKPVFRKYMDDFPFPYYVLLRDIGALPRTLADMLRQWFEMSASS